ncbi:alanine-phosphoribitol ligase [Streptomyces capparidis]
MRSVLVVGAGQAGLLLALGLLDRGYAVTVVTDRDPERIRAGPVTSTQVLFARALAVERGLGLDLWRERAPLMRNTRFTVSGPGGRPAVDWAGDCGGASSVDQRLKMSTWLELFARRGGRVLIRAVDAAGLDALAGGHDLVVVAAGRGEPVRLFPRDRARSAHHRPPRHLAAVYLHGTAPGPSDDGPTLRIDTVPGAGEIVFMPALTLSGPCEIALVEAVPGGPLDVFGTLRDPGGVWALTRDLIRAHTPWEYARVRAAEPTDGRAALCGAFTPVVRHPVAALPSGRLVLGLGDAVALVDPVAGQGANNACHAAARCLRRITGHGDRPFDAAWMRATFEDAWRTRLRDSVRLTDTLLLAPPPEHVLALLRAAGGDPRLADLIARGNDRVEELTELLLDPRAAYAYLAAAAGE